MEYIFFFIWLASTIAIFVFSAKFIKFKIDEKNTKGWNFIKSKITNIFKPKEKQKKKAKFTGEQLQKFMIGSIIASFVSFCLFVATVPPVEETDNNNSSITENSNNEDIIENETVIEENTSTEENKTEENENVTTNIEEQEKQEVENKKTTSLSNIPAYSGSPYVAINDNKPFFISSDLTTTSYEKYSNLDDMGRCGVAIASVGKDLMPTEERGNIGSIKPTGWHSVRYQGIDGNYLYNRCHLIGFQLSGENANEKNLITGTRYMNVEGMLLFENMVADYVKETGNHVVYRVTPIFSAKNLLASGVLMEAKSVEDNGEGIEFNVYCYNVQPGIEINYATGNSSGPEYTGSNSNSSTNNSQTTNNNSGNNSNNTSNTNSSQTTTEQTTTVPVAPSTPVEEPKKEETIPVQNQTTQTYILNTNTKKFHYSSCGSAKRIKDSNKDTYSGSRDELIARGYSPCGNCDP